MDLQEGQPQPVQPGSGFAPHPADEPPVEPPASDEQPAAPQIIPPRSGFAPHPADEVEHEEEVAPDPASHGEIIEPERSFTWQASEYVQHHKSPLWYFGLFGITLVLCAALVWLHQYTALAVVAVMAIAIAAISRKAPRTLQYSLDDHGLVVDGKSFAYDKFRSYSVFQEVGWRTIDLEPSQRLIPSLSIICENDTFDTIEDILSEQLPRHDRKPDWVERLTRYLHF